MPPRTQQMCVNAVERESTIAVTPQQEISLRTIVSTALALIVFSFSVITVEHVSAQIMRSPQAQAEQQDLAAEIQWPTPSQILSELSEFESHPITAEWVAETRELVSRLCTETEVNSQEAVELLVKLTWQSQMTDELIGQMQASAQYGEDVSELTSSLQRFRYGFDRRIKIWAGVIDHANSLAAKGATPVKQVSLSWLPPNLDEMLAQQIPGNHGWQAYLGWDELIRASRAVNMDKKARIALRKSAQKFLARYYSPSLTDAQRDLFQPYFSPDVLDSIRDAASEEVDHTRLMKLIEGLEQKGRGDYAAYLNRQYQSLLWSTDPIAQELAVTIDSHWRNANFRVAINERLLNQMLPQVPATTEPVSERVLGADVSGQSLIETDQLRIALLPNPSEISLAIESAGQVTSDTVAQRSGFTFQNHGLANFRVFQKLAFSRTNVTSEAPQATSSVRQKLVGLRGSYDRVPILGRLSRSIAKKKANETTPEANALTRDRVEMGAEQRVESEVNEMVAQFRRGLHEHVLSRLIAMDLEPETVQLSTSQSRIVGRYRIAGRDQMAAWQPRPTDSESDLLTVQMHQSAINNLLLRFAIGGKEFDVTSFAEHIEKVTGIPAQNSENDAEASFTFDKFDPIRVDFTDGIASVTFSFKRFQIGSGRAWKNVDIKANFRPTYNGTQIVLDRDNLFEVSSKSDLRLADQIAIRGAFTVILQQQYSLDLLPAVVREKVPSLVLGIGQLSLAEGWCGVTFNNEPAYQQYVPVITSEEFHSPAGVVGSLLTEETNY